LKLNARQKAFCEYYVACSNATEAAIKAGYSKKTARVIGQENLTKPYIKKKINELSQKIACNSIMTAKERQEYLTKLIDRYGFEMVKKRRNEGDGFSSARVMKKQVSAKERIKAAELLGKRHALFTDKTKIEGTLPVMIVGEDDLDE